MSRMCVEEHTKTLKLAMSLPLFTPKWASVHSFLKNLDDLHFLIVTKICRNAGLVLVNFSEVFPSFLWGKHGDTFERDLMCLDMH